MRTGPHSWRMVLRYISRVESQQSHSPAHLKPDPVPEPSAGSDRGFLSAFAVDLAPLRASRDYRLLFSSQTISFFGSMMSFVVLPWQMYQLTRSSLAVGLLGVAEFVPTITMAFVGGALADYVDRRRMVLITELLMAVSSALLVLNSLLPHPQVWALFLFATAIAGLNGLKRPSLEALTPRLVSPELMPAVSALRAVGGTLGGIVGPTLGGVLATAAGPAVAYSIDFSTFVVSLIALWTMRATPPPLNADRPSLRSLVEGLRYARSRPELMGTYLIDMNAMFFGMPMALFPAIATKFGGASVGLLYAAPSVGAFVASVASGWTARIYRHGLTVTIAAGVWGLAIVAFGFADRLWLALLWLAVAGAGDMVSGLFRMTIWNQTIPDHLRGRLAGIEMVSYMSGPMLGNAEAGIVASLFSIRTSVISGGILCVLGTGLLALAYPAFVRYDGREGLLRKQREEAERAAAAKPA
ncbi:MAG TPA: MFS transporter [Candidatus Angelobacter sp.]|nr:MFS transporter [Candidatus Angelobacter sp.]